MIRPTALLALLFAVAPPVAAVVTLETGDVLVSSQTFRSEDGFEIPTGSVINVYSRAGMLKGELIRVTDDVYFDIFYREGVIYAASSTSIERISATGVRLPRFTDAGAAIYLSPGPAGGVLSVRTSDFFQFASDGSLIRQIFDPRFGHGIDLASDGCTVFFTTNGSLARLNICLGTGPTTFGTTHPVVFSLIRVLADGTFLVTPASTGSVLHLDANGNVIRDYNMLGVGLALDTDRTSFWTNVGNCLRRVDIASGAVLGETCAAPRGFIAVVGEPRAGFALAAGAAGIPLASPIMLAILMLSIAAIAVIRMR